jgi:hypothetical protein
MIVSQPFSGTESGRRCSVPNDRLRDVLPDVLVGARRELMACAIENDLSIAQNQKRSIGIRRGLLRRHHLALLFVEAMGRHSESVLQAMGHHQR